MKKLKKTIEYDTMDFGVLMILEAHLDHLMDAQPNLNSLKTEEDKESYGNGQETILKYQTIFREMRENLNEK
ncbi:MAG: hypothetical protein EBR82_12440 [Caulobacteraceae bacterium]|nr:hypothetical protein [Caulobacteraceae bacterium]